MKEVSEGEGTYTVGTNYRRRTSTTICQCTKNFWLPPRRTQNFRPSFPSLFSGQRYLAFRLCLHTPQIPSHRHLHQKNYLQRVETMGYLEAVKVGLLRCSSREHGWYSTKGLWYSKTFCSGVFSREPRELVLRIKKRTNGCKCFKSRFLSHTGLVTTKHKTTEGVLVQTKFARERTRHV